MSEKLDTILLWFRNDLRVLDHRGLQQALLKKKRVIAYYSFSPQQYQSTPWGFKKIEKYRARFTLQSVEDLQTALKKLNIPLYVDLKSPEHTIPLLVDQYSVRKIYLQNEWTQEEVDQEKQVAKVIKEKLEWEKNYDQMLFHPKDLPFSLEETPMVFGHFRKLCEKQMAVAPLAPSPQPLAEENWMDFKTPIPSLSALGLEEFEQERKTAFPFKGGSAAGRDRMNHYFWNTQKLSYYKNTRNGLVGTDYSSKFSPWLANGSLSPRMIYWEIKRYEREIQKNQSTYWLIFELIWRDFFKYISLKHGNKIFKIGGILEKNYQWKQDKALFDRWKNGQTQEAFVNANMIELRQTGWMSNRGRQNVASYFAKELTMDWRMGAAYFESMLLDYDVHSNYGNWMYVSGVGNDPRDRKFDVRWQAQQYDANGKFQNLWLQKSLF